HYPSHDRSAVRRALSHVTMMASMALIGTEAIDPPDVIHVYQGSATLMVAAVVLSRLRGGQIVLDVQDLWPESVLGSGMLDRGAVGFALGAFCRWTYGRAARIMVLSASLKEVLEERGVPANKIDVVYNWCDEAAVPANPRKPRLADVNTNDEARVFKVVYAGNMGHAQGLECALGAARILAKECPKVEIILVGDGVEKDSLRQAASKERLENIVFLPRQAPDELAETLADADIFLLHLREDPLSNSAVPQKTQVYLRAGRPIVAAVNGEAGWLVEASGAGLRCEPDDPAAMASCIRALAALDEEERVAMGVRGTLFYEAEMSFKTGVTAVERAYAEALRGALAPRAA
ncbi:glycosyltransferase WbuB, partial [bacterium]|nr:glycosyltransferase WbuB [bacterium]